MTSLAPSTSSVHAHWAGVSYAWERTGKPVLSNFELQLFSGEHLGLLGPNGSGKSTALSLLSGLTRPSTGTVTWQVKGQRLSPTDAAAREQFSVVFQAPSLDVQLGVRENLELAAQLRGISSADRITRINALLREFDLESRAKERVKTLSGGFKRRVDLARALSSHPSALLLDEPTAGLDDYANRSFWDLLLKHRAQRSLSIVTATHRADEVALCDRVALIYKGRVHAIEAPKQLLRRYGAEVLELDTFQPTLLKQVLADKFKLTSPRLDAPNLDGQVRLTCALPSESEGAQLLARLIEATPAGTVIRCSIRPPSLADVFATLTGSALSEDASTLSGKDHP